MTDSVKVFAPATVANVTCGFDILGFAVDAPGDEITLKKNNQGKVIIREIKGDEGRLPLDPGKNTCGVVIQHFLRDLALDQGIDIFLHKKMPLGSGLGSSAASAVAAIYAINELMGKPCTRKELLPYAMEGERVACGAAHADNVAPSLLGGFVLVRSYDPLDTIALPVPDELFATLVHPQIEVRTKDAREILKREIRFSDSVRQSGNVGGLVAGLLMSDYQLISNSLVDHIVEPIRAILIPGYDEVKAAAKEQGTLGAGISGSGPSLFALSKGHQTAYNIGEAMREIFNAMDIENEVYISKINQIGPKVLD
ncbi:MAG: homoserine kinase [Cyclobacteriaceae bacterium]|nr:homoserine kinase [Cyclobacteriaceae bacterium]